MKNNRMMENGFGWIVIIIILLILIIVLLISIYVSFRNGSFAGPFAIASVTGSCDMLDVFEMKKLWDIQSALFREWTIAKVDGGNCLVELNEALMQNQVAIANNFARFSDTIAANKFSNYLQTHVIQGSQIINMMISNADPASIDRLYEEWKNNSKLMAGLMSENIKSIDPKEAENLFTRYLNSTMEQTKSIVEKKCDISKFLIVMDNQNLITSYLAKNLGC